MPKIALSGLLLLLALAPASALNNGYTVYIVGTQYEQPGLPTVYYPPSALNLASATNASVLAANQTTQSSFTPATVDSSSQDSGPLTIGAFVTPTPPPVVTSSEADEANDFSFIVVLQNDRATRTLLMCASDWYESLTFKITDASGNTYTVTRTPFDWPNKLLQECTLRQGQKREMAVDFTGRANANTIPGWQGLPTTALEAQTVTMTVTFRGYDSNGKFVSATSKPTKVYFKPQS